MKKLIAILLVCFILSCDDAGNEPSTEPPPPPPPPTDTIKPIQPTGVILVK